MSYWTEDRVTNLLKLWKEGHSAAEISRIFGDVTRNAVIGKIHRLDVPKRKTVKPRKLTASASNRKKLAQKCAVRVKRRPRKYIRPQASRIQPARLVNKGLITILALERGMCRWPYGVPGEDDFHYCGRASLDGKSYCQDHFNVSVRDKRDFVFAEELLLWN